MPEIDISKYQGDILEAIKYFWTTRNSQIEKQISSELQDHGNRGAVTGGKQLDGFIVLLKKIAVSMGIDDSHIFIKGNNLPGFFRPTKDWDFIVISPKKHLITAIELKSQVGSFGNNFNNRTEEALGSAVDIWTAYREKAFPDQQPPFIGYVMVVEKSDRSISPVRISETHFAAFPEFRGSSYLDRYKILCQKLMRERHYSATAVIWTTPNFSYGSLSEDISFDAFLLSFIGHLQSKLGEFKQ